MRSLSLLALLLCLVTPSFASAQSSRELRSAIRDCLNYAILKGNLDNSPVDGLYEATLSCSESPARDLYVAVGRAGIAETMAQFVERERGLSRRFGKSACFQITQNASGEPTQSFHCRIALDIGGVLLRSF